MAAVGENPLNTQAFWNDFMRKPEVRAAYQQDKRLQEKKTDWLQARRAIEERGDRRKLIADELENAPADVKKLIAPMFHIKIVEHFLWMIYDECQKKGMPFMVKLRDDGTMEHLRKLRMNFEQGGEEQMKKIEGQWLSICGGIVDEQEKEKDAVPRNVDVHTLKHVLEYGQECKRMGNEKFREGLYEEALFIYGQGDDMMKKFKVGSHLKNESKWLKDYHLACLKNKSQAALKLERWQTALDAAEGALGLDSEDPKALYRKSLALKGLGKFRQAEEALQQLEDIAHWCADRRQILKDCEAERKRILVASAKHKDSTKGMLGKAFEAGVFGGNREKEMEEAAKLASGETAEVAKAVADAEEPKKPDEPIRPLERNIQLTAALAGDLLDELSDAYGQKWFQERVQKCARDSMFQRQVFLPRLKGIAIEVQRPVLEKWGFEGSEHGVREMTAAVRECVRADGEGQGMPDWLKEKQDRCLELLYGGKEEGMAVPMLGR